MPGSAPGALNKALLLALSLCLAAPMPAGIREREAAVEAARLQADLRQLLFGKRIVAEARRHIGEPYLWGGKAGDAGLDCSGYAQAVYLACGLRLPANSQAQLMEGVTVQRDNLQPGDLCFFQGIGSPFHVGIYEGQGRFLQAPGTGKRIQSTALKGAWIGRRWIGARRFAPPPEPTPTPTPTPTPSQTFTATDHPHRETQP